MSKTALALYARLNYRRAVRYLEHLSRLGLVEVENEVKLTRGGGLEALEKIEEVLRALGL
ncbi:MAG: hypothetical protein JZD41_00635 [Thermoproteus sp.]|nr:hypothetical protein [Thermoproteus sp.]